LLTLNEAWFPCDLGQAFELACRVDRWPQLLPHYRWVRFHRGSPDAGGIVEMAARRDFGALPWPVWWVSEMRPDPVRAEIRYTHIKGITRGMEVVWQLKAADGGTHVAITHEWRAAGGRIIGPLFVAYVADQTLKHLGRGASAWTGAGQ
jgi:ribosome-associated toxin RatA of RatAB toxin-antitoxin module